MKPIFLLLFSLGILQAEPSSIKLIYRQPANIEEEGKDDYSKQIEEGFAKLLESDAKLAKEFKRFEQPIEDGKYSGRPTVIPIQLTDAESFSRLPDGAKRHFSRKIALYYRFELGHSAGRETRSGFFALFNLECSFTDRRDNYFEKIDPSEVNIAAQFEGFSRTLTAPDVE